MGLAKGRPLGSGWRRAGRGRGTGAGRPRRRRLPWWIPRLRTALGKARSASVRAAPLADGWHGSGKPVPFCHALHHPATLAGASPVVGNPLKVCSSRLSHPVRFRRQMHPRTKLVDSAESSHPGAVSSAESLPTASSTLTSRWNWPDLHRQLALDSSPP